MNKVTESDFNYKASEPKVKGDIAQNEKDLYEGPILEELGINFKMIGQKLKYSLPFTKTPQSVAEYPEMVYGGLCLLTIFVIGLISNVKLNRFIPIMFGTLIYGSIVFKILINLLCQGNLSVDLYFVMSAICYSLTPTLILWAVLAFVRVSYPVYLACALPCCAAAAYVLWKHVDAVIQQKDLRVLLMIPAAIFSSFWILMGRGLAK